jgi:hypothetical protein
MLLILSYAQISAGLKKLHILHRLAPILNGVAALDHPLYVKSVFVMIHVGGTRCVTFSTDNIMNIHVRTPLNVECIRGYILIFLFDVSIQLRV